MGKQSNAETAAAILTEFGFVPDGATEQQQVRIPTVKNPVFGGVGGERRTFGGRTRFAKGDLRATVGKITTCIYRKVPGQRDVVFLANVPTKDAEAIRAALKYL